MTKAGVRTEHQHFVGLQLARANWRNRRDSSQDSEPTSASLPTTSGLSPRILNCKRRDVDEEIMAKDKGGSERLLENRHKLYRHAMKMLEETGARHGRPPSSAFGWCGGTGWDVSQAIHLRATHVFRPLPLVHTASFGVEDAKYYSRAVDRGTQSEGLTFPVEHHKRNESIRYLEAISHYFISL